MRSQFRAVAQAMHIQHTFNALLHCADAHGRYTLNRAAAAFAAVEQSILSCQVDTTCEIERILQQKRKIHNFNIILQYPKIQRCKIFEGRKKLQHEYK